MAGGLSDLVVNPVAHQTGAAGGMETVIRAVDGAIGGQLSATLLARGRARYSTSG
jgi:hypothetical protein